MRENSYFKLFQLVEIILALYLHFKGILWVMTWTMTNKYCLFFCQLWQRFGGRWWAGEWCSGVSKQGRAAGLLALSQVLSSSMEGCNFHPAAYLFIVSCSFSTTFTFLLYNKPSFLSAIRHLVNPSKRFRHIFLKTVR